MFDFGVSMCMTVCAGIHADTHKCMHGKWITSHTLTPTTSLGFRTNHVVIYLYITQLPM